MGSRHNLCCIYSDDTPEGSHQKPLGSDLFVAFYYFQRHKDCSTFYNSNDDLLSFLLASSIFPVFGFLTPIFIFDGILNVNVMVFFVLFYF